VLLLSLVIISIIISLSTAASCPFLCTRSGSATGISFILFQNSLHTFLTKAFSLLLSTSIVISRSCGSSLAVIANTNRNITVGVFYFIRSLRSCIWPCKVMLGLNGRILLSL
jgi:hypothetical protein